MIPLTTMRKILTLFKHRDIDVQRMHLDGLDTTTGAGSESGETGVTMVRMLVNMPSQEDQAECMAALVQKYFA